MEQPDTTSGNREIQKRFLFLLLAILGVMMLWLGLQYFLGTRNPVYQGKSLSAWIAPFCQQTTNGFNIPGGPAFFEELQPTRGAIREIGTNGLPFLMATLNDRESTLHKSLRQWSNKQPFPGLRLKDPRVNRVRAIRALAVLGPAARPAIPELVAQLGDPVLGTHAVYALQAAGSDGMRALVNQLTNRSALIILEIGTAIMTSSAAADEATREAIIDGLIALVQSPTYYFQSGAVQRLAMMGSAASNAVPILLAALNDPNPMFRELSIRALGEIHSHPELAIPALTNFLDDADMNTRIAALFALQRFGYPATLKMPGGFSSGTGTNRAVRGPQMRPWP